MSYRESVGHRIPPRFAGWMYWGKGVPGFGDKAARLWIVGLAPAAHGANRTGRLFTGDNSGEWLCRALYETGFANQPHSWHAADGLELRGAFISAVLRCVPPSNTPLHSELQHCFPYLQAEWNLLRPTLRVVIPLGQVAYKQVCKLLGWERAPAFKHGLLWRSEDGIFLLSSYHPSRRNTSTKRLRWEAWIEIFRRARFLCDSEE
ncbi:MAG: uracil-DNA glycosylase [Bacteroidia bacterium]|nr:uracil-DNA glycosylase [Bacteroidia bacterium]MDW8016132.1 uracil-DNA glycosylase [Bacteroidia bacterium]